MDVKKDEPVFVLVVMAPGPLQDGLRAILASLGCSVIIREAHDVSTAAITVEKCRPALLILDAAALDNGGVELIGRIKQATQATRSIVLARDVGQGQAVAFAGVDTVLLEGARAVDLAEAVAALLSYGF